MRRRGKAGGTADWQPRLDVTDERLAFLVAKDELRKQSRSIWMTLWRILVVGGGPSIGTRGMALAKRGGTTLSSDMVREVEADGFQPYVIACDELASTLTPAERRMLRAEGQLPDWFVPAVCSRAKRVKAELRRNR